MSNSNAFSPRARHLAALPALALAALIAACNTGGTATPQPTNQPPVTNPPATPAGPTPTPSPSPTPSFNADQISHPTGATDVVLRMEVGGGFVPMGFMLTQAPQFTLFGDGTVIFQQIDNRQGGLGELAYLPWLKAKMDEEGIQALLRYALSTGRLANAKENYENGMVADAPSTIFTLNAADLSKVVNIYALGMEGQPGPDQADRNGFSQLAAVLNDFQNQEGLGEVVEYEPELYRVVLLEGFGEPQGEIPDWPWADVSTDDFAQDQEFAKIANLDAEHVSAIVDVPNGGHPGIWAHDPDGNLVQLGVRPLLPDEVAAVRN